MAYKDNTIKVERLGHLCKSIRTPSAIASKTFSTTVVKNPETAFEIGYKMIVQ